MPAPNEFIPVYVHPKKYRATVWINGRTTGRICMHVYAHSVEEANRIARDHVIRNIGVASEEVNDM